MNTQEFLESYIKESIITEFSLWSAMHLKTDLVYMRDITENRPILTMGDIEGCEGMKKFALTNVVYFNKFRYRAEQYTITGIISTLNNGRIIITSYDVKQ